ncbi:MAG: HlyD family efflux transporter periplasmic adaptor subunit, partial [Dehalococcoidia bacterium]|nr:HlyD family efflux transporter periplasmic adaptor subunit [Dehalococcoidia bacterium]
AMRDAETGVKSAEKAMKDTQDLYDIGAVAQAEAGMASAQAQLKGAEKAYQDVQTPYNLSPYTPSDIASAEAAVASAQSQLKGAEKGFLDVQSPYNLSPYTPSDIASAEAAVAAAQAQMRDATNALSKAQTTKTDEDVAHFQSAVDSAQKTMAVAQQDFETVKFSRDRSVSDTQELLRQEQEKYKLIIKINLTGDSIYMDPRILFNTETISNSMETAYQSLLRVRDNARIAQETGDKNVANAEVAVSKAQDVVKKAQEDLDRKLGDVPVDVAIRQYNLETAKANLIKAQEDLKKRKAGPEPLEVANRQFALENAKANLAKAQEDLKKRKAGPEPLDIANRQAGLENARANLIKAQEDLKKKKAGPDPLELALRKSQIVSAQAALDKAKDNLAKATIVAPFDGMIASVVGEVGDSVGGSAVHIVMVNPNKLRMEAILDETSVIQVKVGQDVQISMDALPNTSINGKVTSISPVSTVQSGVVNYQLFITLDSQVAAGQRTTPGGNRTGGTPPGASSQRPGGAATQGRTAVPNNGGTTSPNTPGSSQSTPPSQLRSGMTAVAEIVTTSYDDVILIPRQAVSGSGQNRTVKVITNGQVEDRPVQLGVSDEQFIQVTQGLTEGEKVLITTAAPRSINPVSRPGGGLGGGAGIPGIR